MSTKAVSVEARLAIGAQVVLEEVSGASVTQICREYGISRDTYYRYRRRMHQEGVEGLVPRSTRPRNSPGATPADVVAVVVAKHDELVEQGWDGGAQSVHDWLAGAGVQVPSARTCHKILRDHGRTTPTPSKRPKSRLLDAYDVLFNTQRPHQGIGGVTPASRYASSDKAVADASKLTQRQFIHDVTLSPAGYFDLPGARVALGAAWARAKLQYLVDQDHAVLFHENRLLAHIRLDPAKIETPKGDRRYIRVTARP